jgi:hypothetical protein
VALDKLHKLLPKPKHPKHKGVFGKMARWWCTLRAGCGGEKGRERLSEMGWDEHEQGENQEYHVGHRHQGAEKEGLPHLPHPKLTHIPHIPLPSKKKAEEIKAVLKEIRAINKKLQGFEGGFISEEGIMVSRSLRRVEQGSRKGPSRWLVVLTDAVERTGSGTSTRGSRLVNGSGMGRQRSPP